MSGDKTEKPTAKRMRDVRKKGQVASSKEVVSSALILAFFALFLASMPYLMQQGRSLLLLPISFLNADFTDADFASASDSLIHAYATAMVYILAPFILIAIVVAVAASVFQFGFLMSFEAVKPSLKKLNPGEYVKKVFSVQSAVEFLKSNLKIGALGLLIYLVIREGIRAMVLAPTCGVSCLQAVLGSMLTSVLLWSAGPFVAVAAIDLAFQRWNFTKKNMMSKDEVKREYKESEGDPQIKGKRKQLHQQMLADGNVERSRKATVLITNPTHVAVAIYYEEDKTKLPVVTAIGTDAIARRMIEAARAAGVPVMQNVPLAHSLLEGGIIDQYLPSDLIEPFAEVLRSLRALAKDDISQ